MRRGSPGFVDDDAVTAPLRAPDVRFREPLVEAKLAAPYLREAVLPRESLLARLLGTDAGLVTMVAPPGYGKSDQPRAVAGAGARAPVGGSRATRPTPTRSGSSATSASPSSGRSSSSCRSSIGSGSTQAPPCPMPSRG